MEGTLHCMQCYTQQGTQFSCDNLGRYCYSDNSHFLLELVILMSLKKVQVQYAETEVPVPLRTQSRSSTLPLGESFEGHCGNMVFED